MCKYVMDLYSLCFEVTIISKMIDGKDKDLAVEYTNQVYIIFTTIREQSIKVI